MKKAFSYKSYKEFLKDFIELEGRGAVGALATAADCNRTYLSQSLTSKVQLTPDHILGISQYLQLPAEEENFLLLLLLHERSTSVKNQAIIKKKMDAAIQEQLVLTKNINQKNDSKDLSEASKAQYYSTWKYAAVHSLTSIDEFQTAATIAKRLHLNDAETRQVLNFLEDCQLIKNSKEKWIHTGKNIHTPSESVYTRLHHANWKNKAVDDTHNKQSIHYTTVFSLEKKHYEKIKEQLIDYISAQRDKVHASGSEEVFCFSCDLFQV